MARTRQYLHDYISDILDKDSASDAPRFIRTPRLNEVLKRLEVVRINLVSMSCNTLVIVVEHIRSSGLMVPPASALTDIVPVPRLYVQGKLSADDWDVNVVMSNPISNMRFVELTCLLLALDVPL